MPDGGPHLLWNGAVDARSEHRNFCANRRLSEETSGCLAAMAGIARKIELYNLVYRLAWEHISEHQRREQPDIARRLHEIHQAPGQ